MRRGELRHGLGHIREDSLWARSRAAILADANADADALLVGVGDIVRAHWAEFGRDLYVRYDYEEVDAAAAGAMMAHLRSGELKSGLAAVGGGVTLEAVDEFEYVDPVDGSEARLQGVVLTLSGDARAVFRLSGTGSAGATIRLYVERYEADAAKHGAVAADDLKPYAAAAIEFSKLAEFTGRDEPTVIAWRPRGGQAGGRFGWGRDLDDWWFFLRVAGPQGSRAWCHELS